MEIPFKIINSFAKDDVIVYKKIVEIILEVKGLPTINNFFLIKVSFLI